MKRCIICGAHFEPAEEEENSRICLNCIDDYENEAEDAMIQLFGYKQREERCYEE